MGYIQTYSLEKKPGYAGYDEARRERIIIKTGNISFQLDCILETFMARKKHGSRREDLKRTFRNEISRINLFRNCFSGAVTIFPGGSRVVNNNAM